MNKLMTAIGLLCAFVARGAMAETVKTELFTIEVPDGWMIEDDESGAIFVFGSRIVDQMPIPFLMIQYCTNSAVNSATSDKSYLAPCTTRCLEEALSFPQEPKETFSRVERSVTPDGVVELRTRSVSRPDFVAFVGLSCSPLGQVNVGLVSDGSKDETGKAFEAAFASIAWQQTVPPSPELVTENRRLTVRVALPLLRTQWGDGVIFPAAFGDSLVNHCSREELGPGDAYWQPTEADIERAEQILAGYMHEQGLNAPEVHTWPDEPTPKTWPDLKGYQRQYMGVIRGSHKTIYASFVPSEEARADEYWRRRPFHMCDGGSSNFGVETDLTSSAVLHIAFDSCMCHVVPSQ